MGDSLSYLDNLLSAMSTYIVQMEVINRPVADVFGRVFVLTGIFIKGGY